MRDRSTARPNKVQSQLIAASLEGSFQTGRALFFCLRARAASQGQTNFLRLPSLRAPASGRGLSLAHSQFVAAVESIVIDRKSVRYRRLRRSVVNFSDRRVVYKDRRRSAASRQGMPYSTFKTSLALAGFIALCLAVGATGGAVTSTSVGTWYAALEKPAFNPPDWVFAPVWTSST